MIFHDSQNLYYRSPIGAVPTQSFVRLAIDVDLKDKVSLVRLHTWQETCGSIYYNLKKYNVDKDKIYVDYANSLCWSEQPLYYNCII